MRTVIVGGGSALAQPLIRHWLDRGHDVTAVCRTTMPETLGRSGLTVCKVHELPPGPVDLLVTATGMTDDAKIESMSGYQWSSVVSDNLTVVLEALRFCRVADG